MRSTTAAALDCNNAAEEVYGPLESSKLPRPAWMFFVLVLGLLSATSQPSRAAGSLSATNAPIPRGTVINLTAAGPVDWVHWGLYTDTSVDRKAGVSPQISNFKPVYNTGNSNAYAFVY